MDKLLVGIMGLFRIAQSVTNKKISGFTETLRQKVYFGVLFESAAALFSFIYLFIFGFSGIDRYTLLFSLLTGLGFLVELLSSLAALNRAPLSLCTICALGGGVVLPAIFGIFFFGEPLSVIQWLSIAMFLLSAWLITPKSSPDKEFSIISALPFIITNFLVNGALSVIGKYYAVCVTKANPALFSCISYAFAAAIFGIFLLALPRRATNGTAIKFPKKFYALSAFVGAVCATIVFLSVFLAKTVPIVILNTVPTSVCILGSAVIGHLFFKEKITKRALCGVILGIASIVAVLCTSDVFGR